jgi:hypothetical protein
MGERYQSRHRYGKKQKKKKSEDGQKWRRGRIGEMR